METKRDGTFILARPHFLYLIHIPIKLHEDIITVSGLWSVQECK